MAAACRGPATTTQVETLKKALAQPQSCEPNPTPHPEDHYSSTTTTSAAPPSPGDAVEKNISNAMVVPFQLLTLRRRFEEPSSLECPYTCSNKKNEILEMRGSGLHGLEAFKKLEELKRKARAERFGIAQSTSFNDDAIRLARFGPASKPDAVEKDKRKLWLMQKL